MVGIVPTPDQKTQLQDYSKTFGVSPSSDWRLMYDDHLRVCGHGYGHMQRAGIRTVDLQMKKSCQRSVSAEDHSVKSLPASR